MIKIWEAGPHDGIVYLLGTCLIAFTLQEFRGDYPQMFRF